MATSPLKLRSEPKKPGPKPKGFARFNLLLEPAVAEWAMEQPEGLSGIIRRCLRAEHERAHNDDAPARPRPTVAAVGD